MSGHAGSSRRSEMATLSINIVVVGVQLIQHSGQSWLSRLFRMERRLFRMCGAFLTWFQFS
jgi:hypothetical protein